MKNIALLEGLRKALSYRRNAIKTYLPKYKTKITNDGNLCVNGVIFNEAELDAMYVEGTFQLHSGEKAFQHIISFIEEEVDRS